ncbi:MAG: protease SohB [Gammaproteobacteria bacterium]|nr:protease SohB [Gammaproteobacteria bacterium]
MAYLYEYLIFLAQAITIVVAILIVMSSIIALTHKDPHGADLGYLSVTKINDSVRNLRHAMEANLLPPDAVKKQHKQEAKAENKAQKSKTELLKNEQKAAKAGSSSLLKKTQTAVAGDDAEVEVDSVATPSPKRVFVMRFDGDVKASGVDCLSTEISAILTLATNEDEVVVCLESPGGMVHSYGLAASQLMRIRDQGIPLTAAVDKVAASGGYLMAAVANKIIAAPFALIGSIGVVAQVPNVYRLLKKNDVDVEVLTAGKYKRTLTTLGENTEEGRRKFVEELEDVHALFQEFVLDNRPELDIEKVATGEAWYGKRALELNLVDSLSTSDQYLIDLCEHSDVFDVKWQERKKPIDKLMSKVTGVLDKVEGVLSSWRA